MRHALVVLVILAGAIRLEAQQPPLRLEVGAESDVWSEGQRPEWYPAGTDVDGHDLIVWNDSVNPAAPEELLAATPDGSIDHVAGPSPRESDLQASTASGSDSVLVIWSESQRLMGRVYTRSGDPRTVQIADGICRVWPHSLAANDGRFVVIAGTQCDGEASALTLMTLNSDGNVAQTLDLGTAIAPTHAAVVPWGAGFVAVWSTSLVICHGEGCPPDKTAVRALRLNRYGIPLDDAPLELQNEQGSAGPPAVATSGDSALVFWSDALCDCLRVARILMTGDGVDERLIASGGAVGSLDAVGGRNGAIVVWQRDETPQRSLMLTRLVVDDFDVEPLNPSFVLATSDCTDNAPCAFSPFFIPHANSHATLVYQQTRENVFEPKIATRGVWYARRVHAAVP